MPERNYVKILKENNVLTIKTAFLKLSVIYTFFYLIVLFSTKKNIFFTKPPPLIYMDLVFSSSISHEMHFGSLDYSLASHIHIPRIPFLFL